MKNYKEELMNINPMNLNSEKIKEYARAAKIQLAAFFNPSTIALVGASRRENTPGWIMFKNLVENAKTGKLKAKVYGVNIKGGSLFGEPLYKSLLDIRDVIDHVVIAVPNRFVPQVMEDAAQKGAKAITIISSGFSEVGNVELEKEILEIARKHDMRIIGPNGLGLLDTYSGVDTLFLPTYKTDLEGKILLSTPRPPPGYIAFLSQSGAMGASMLDYMYGEEMGISKFISAGNKIDVDEIDILLYALEDPTIRVIMLYVEGIKGRGDVLVRIGKYVAREKPIVVVKGGRTSAGARAAASHTASIAGNAAVYEAAFKEMGAIYANELLDFLDIAKALAFQPPGGGNNIGIVTNGGGAGILASDCAESIGLKVLPFTDRVMKTIHEYVEDGTIPRIATFANPIDLSADGSDEAYIAAVETLLEEPTIEGLVVITLHQTPNISSRFPEKLAMVVNRYRKPVTVVDIGGADMAQWFRREFDRRGIPSYPTPERAVKALKSLIDYGIWLKREGIFEEFIERWERPKAIMTAPVISHQ